MDMTNKLGHIQRWAKYDAQDLENFVAAVAYHLCLNLAAEFTQPGASTLADLCRASRFQQHTNDTNEENRTE